MPGASHAFYLDFVAFVSRYFLHMDKEERITNAALQRAFTDEQLAAIEAKLVASIQPDMVEPFFARMLPAMNPTEREALLRDVKEHAPEPVFFGMWAIAKNALERVFADEAAGGGVVVAGAEEGQAFEFAVTVPGELVGIGG